MTYRETCEAEDRHMLDLARMHNNRYGIFDCLAPNYSRTSSRLDMLLLRPVRGLDEHFHKTSAASSRRVRLPWTLRGAQIIRLSKVQVW